MTTLRLDAHPLRRPDGTLPDIRDYPEGESNLMPSFAHDRARLIVTDLLVDLLAPASLVATDLAVLRDPHNWRNHLVPDILVALGAGELDPVYGVLRHQYRLWDEARPPDLVIELASPTTVGRDNIGKREDYAAMGVREYVQFDPLEELFSPGLRVYQLRETRYQQVMPDAQGGFPSVVLPTFAWVQVGIQLRLRERATGRLAPTAAEARDREAARADAAATRAAAEAARANAEAARAETATTRAEAEAARAEEAEAELARLRAELARARANTTDQPDRGN